MILFKKKNVGHFSQNTLIFISAYRIRIELHFIYILRFNFTRHTWIVLINEQFINP